MSAERRIVPRTVLDVVASVPLPEPVLTHDELAALRPRDKALLRDLKAVFIEEGFVRFTMAELAARLRCSLRDLYALGKRRDLLFLIVVDSLAFSYGRDAITAIGPSMSAVEAVEAYLLSGNNLVSLFSGQLAEDIAATPDVSARLDVYAAYGVEVVHQLLLHAVDIGELGAVPAGPLARLLAGAARDFARPEAAAAVGPAPEQAANDVVRLVLGMLAEHGAHPHLTIASKGGGTR